jgi:hypothetical protein
MNLPAARRLRGARRASLSLAAALLLAACSREPTAPLLIAPGWVTVDGLRFTAAATGVGRPTTVHLEVVATNVSDAAIDIFLAPDCAFFPRAYRGTARGAPPVWDPHATDPDCPDDHLVRLTLEPGAATVAWSRAVPAAEILGAAGAEGRYTFTVLVHPRDRPDEALEVLAGDVPLRL